MLSRKSIPAAFLISTFLASSCFLSAAYATEVATDEDVVEEVDGSDGRSVGDHSASPTVVKKDKEAPKKGEGAGRKTSDSPPVKREPSAPPTPAKKEVREEKAEKKGDGETDEAPVTDIVSGGGGGGMSYLGSMFANLSFRVSRAYSPETEQAKFYNLSLPALQKCFSEEDEYVAIRDKRIKYTTGTHESASDFYDGFLIFLDLDYGTAAHRYRGPQLGFDSNAHLTSVRDVVRPYKFIQDLITEDGVTSTFYKGTPSKLHDTTTAIEYVLYNEAGTKYVKVKASRKKATDMPSGAGIGVGKGVAKPKSEDEVD